MKQKLLDFSGRFFGRSFIFYFFACASAAIVAALVSPAHNPVFLFFVIGLFALPVILPFAVIIGLWFAAWLPHGMIGWMILFVVSMFGGVLGSWWFQSLRPFDWYHESDGSMPGWEPVTLLSDTTVELCIIFLAAAVCTALLSRRSRTHHDT